MLTLLRLVSVDQQALGAESILLTDPRFPAVALMGNPKDARVVESLRLLASHLSAQGLKVLVANALGPGRRARRICPDSTNRICRARASLGSLAVGGDGSMPLCRPARLAGSGVPSAGHSTGGRASGFSLTSVRLTCLARLDEVLAR